MNNSRTKKTIKNSIYATIFFAIQFILAFYSRKVFLDYLGEDVLGLNTTAVNILQFLNLAELGIGFAVAYSLYSPLHKNDHETINEILTLQGQLYRRIASIIIIGALAVMCFFPLIFKKIALPLWYAYASFGVLLFSSLLGYFFNYRQIILTASQKDYKIQQSFGVCNLLKVITQIIILSHAPNPYLWWLVIEVLFSIIGSVALHLSVKKTYPYIKDVTDNYKVLRKKHSSILIKTKQLFFHSIGGFALSQSSPLIIYAYASLSLVAIYGNYMIISNGIMRLFNSVFNSMAAGIGDLIAEGDKKKIMKVFYEIFSFRFLLSSTVVFVLIIAGQAFIEIWIGQKYLLSFSTLIIISTTLFIRLNRYTVNHFIAGCGQYQDIFSPIIEACLNIGLSILLGYFYGLDGILSGVLISLICIVELWKPYFLLRYVLHESIKKYYLNYFKLLLWATGMCIGGFYLFNYTWSMVSHNWITLALFAFLFGILYLVVAGAGMWFISPSIRTLEDRLKTVFTK